MSDSQTVDILRALGDETRLGIVKFIAAHQQPVSSCAIIQSRTSLSRLSQPNLSHHFTKLVDTKILLLEKHGTQNTYRLNKKLLNTTGINVHKL